MGEFQNQFSEEKSHYAKAVRYEMELPIVAGLSHLCLLKLEGDEMNNPGSAQYKIALNERRGDEAFKMHNVNAILKVFFNKEKEIALEKWGHDALPLLLRLYVLVSWLYTFHPEPFASWPFHSLRLPHIYSLLCSFM